MPEPTPTTPTLEQDVRQLIHGQRGIKCARHPVSPGTDISEEAPWKWNCEMCWITAIVAFAVRQRDAGKVEATDRFEPLSIEIQRLTRLATAQRCVEIAESSAKAWEQRDAEADRRYGAAHCRRMEAKGISTAIRTEFGLTAGS